MSDPAEDAKAARRFLFVAFVIAIAIGLLIAYFGIHGEIGAGIP